VLQFSVQLVTFADSYDSNMTCEVVKRCETNCTVYSFSTNTSRKYTTMHNIHQQALT